MPVYVVTTPMGSLSHEQKEKLAFGITAIHGEETGAPEPLIHVVFSGYPEDSAWSSCKPGHPHIINASIRAGRSQEIRERMLTRMTDLMVETTGVSPRNVLVGLFDFNPRWAMEAGMVLPLTDPAEEGPWEEEFYRRYPEDQNALASTAG